MASSNRTILMVLGAAVTAAGFHDLANRYGGFRLWDGPPANLQIHPLELAFDAWYLAFGVVMVALVTMAISGRSDDVAQLEDRLRKLGKSPWLVPVTGLVVLTAALAVKDIVLAGAPVSDDESVYDFIAKTLALGRVKNPVPPFARADLAFLDTNFVILGDNGWYGKYPIGHPLLLALGEVVGARFVVCPLLAAITAVVTVLVARRLLGGPGAAITALLVGSSPQLICTAATNHSQNTTTLMMMLTVLALLHAAESEGRRRLALLVGAGLALGAGFLARPLPGALFVVGAAPWLVLQRSAGPAGRSARGRLFDLVAVGVPVAVFAGLLGLTNALQSGNPLVSGYETVHGGAFGVHTDGGAFSSSLASAILRQSFWAFGWPCSLLFVPFATRRLAPSRPSLTLVWVMLAAGYSYRLIGPKVFVGTTGPIYVAEMVPLIAILSAAGMIRLRSWLRDLRPSFGAIPASMAIASVAAAAVMFLPFQLAWLSDVSRPQRFTPDTLVSREVKRALVFSMNVTRLRGATWALWPPPPSPGLDEPIVYVRRAHGANRHRAMYDFWQRYFPDRRAFVLEEGNGPLVLRELPRDLVPPAVEGLDEDGDPVAAPGPPPAVSADRR